MLAKEHEGRAPWRERTLERAVLLVLVVSELAWLVVLGTRPTGGAQQLDDGAQRGRL